MEHISIKLPVTLSASEGWIESLPEPPMYKHQEHYLYFDHDFDNKDDDNDDSSIVDKEAERLWLCLPDESILRESPLTTQASLHPSIIPTITPMTAAIDLLLTLINQVPIIPLPPPSPSSLILFNFPYIDVTPPQTTSPSTYLHTVTSSSLSLVIKTVIMVQ